MSKNVLLQQLQYMYMYMYCRCKEISRRVAEMVARDLQPISIVEGNGFRNLMSYIDPGYTVPSHTE